MSSPQYTVLAGNPAIFSTSATAPTGWTGPWTGSPFTSTATGNAADPTTVTFAYQVGSGATTVWVYGTNSQVKKSATGVYYIDDGSGGLDTTNMGGSILTGQFKGTGAVYALAEVVVEVTAPKLI